jgi:hypothetical protein
MPKSGKGKPHNSFEKMSQSSDSLIRFRQNLIVEESFQRNHLLSTIRSTATTSICVEDIKGQWNTDSSHRSKVIEWLDVILTTQVSGEIEKMNKRANALKIHEAYRTSKGITKRRYIDKEQSPQCQIDMGIITDHFRRT